MADGGNDQVEEKPIGELFGQLIDEGKAYARAEFDLAKAQAEAKAADAKKPGLLAGASVLFLVGAVVLLCIALAIGLAIFVGPLAGAALATLIAFGISYGLFLLAKREAEKL